MNCKEARKWVSPYLDSELGQTKTFEVSEHLRNCSKCAARFSAERRADELTRSRLAREAMPSELWVQVSRDVSVPSWVRRLRVHPGLAIAACLAIVLTAVPLLQLVRHTQGNPWIVDRFATEAADGQPFRATKGDRASAERLLRDEFEMQLAISPAMAAAGHYDFHLVSAAKRTDHAGREFIEVRLNCCGQPVLLALARPTAGELPAPFEGIAVSERRLVKTFGGVNLVATNIRGVVALAASRHQITHIAENLRVGEV